MAQDKTQPNDQAVEAFIAAVPNEKKRADALVLLEMMQEVTGQEAKMWGPSIIGFGAMHYQYESGREGDTFVVGFSPRKAAISLYVAGGHERYPALMQKLGKHTTGASCIYIKKLADVDPGVLRELIQQAVDSAGAK